jgi:hypothetical protein
MLTKVPNDILSEIRGYLTFQESHNTHLIDKRIHKTKNKKCKFYTFKIININIINEYHDLITKYHTNNRLYYEFINNIQDYICDLEIRKQNTDYILSSLPEKDTDKSKYTDMQVLDMLGMSREKSRTIDSMKYNIEQEQRKYKMIIKNFDMRYKEIIIKIQTLILNYNKLI